MGDDFRPKKPRTITVLKPDGTKARDKRKGDFVRALIVDQDGKLLQSMEWSIDRLARQVGRARKKGLSTVRIAYGLTRLGEDAGTAAYEEIMAALARRK